MSGDGREETVRSGPFGWVQWKGTKGCIDLHCACGAFGHVDTEFTYAVECRKCGKRYDVSGFVALVENPNCGDVVLFSDLNEDNDDDDDEV